MKNFIIWLQKLYIYYFVAKDRREKCPCCGIRQLHPMRYDPDSKKVLHLCKTLYVADAMVAGCGAVWGIDCLIDPTAWEVVQRTQDEDGRTRTEQPDVEKKEKVEVTREPVIIRSQKHA